MKVCLHEALHGLEQPIPSTGQYSRSKRRKQKFQEDTVSVFNTQNQLEYRQQGEPIYELEVCWSQAYNQLRPWETLLNKYELNTQDASLSKSQLYRSRNRDLKKSVIYIWVGNLLERLSKTSSTGGFAGGNSWVAAPGSCLAVIAVKGRIIGSELLTFPIQHSRCHILSIAEMYEYRTWTRLHHPHELFFVPGSVRNSDMQFYIMRKLLVISGGASRDTSFGFEEHNGRYLSLNKRRSILYLTASGSSMLSSQLAYLTGNL